jgi:hypothetical protein
MGHRFLTTHWILGPIAPAMSPYPKILELKVQRCQIPARLQSARASVCGAPGDRGRTAEACEIRKPVQVSLPTYRSVTLSSMSFAVLGPPDPKDVSVLAAYELGCGTLQAVILGFAPT